MRRLGPLIAGLLLLASPTFAQSTDQGLRLTPAEITALATTSAKAGTSGVVGIQTRVLSGDPSQPGLYTIEIRVPANTRIQPTPTRIRVRRRSSPGPGSSAMARSPARRWSRRCPRAASIASPRMRRTSP